MVKPNKKSPSGETPKGLTMGDNGLRMNVFYYTE